MIVIFHITFFADDRQFTHIIYVVKELLVDYISPHDRILVKLHIAHRITANKSAAAAPLNRDTDTHLTPSDEIPK